MHVPTSSSRRLAGAAAIACAAALAPAAALAATAFPAASCSSRRRGQHAEMHDIRARRLAGQPGKRCGGQRLLQPRANQPVRARVHPLRLSKCLRGQPRRRPDRTRGVPQQLPKAARGHARPRRDRDRRAADPRGKQLPGLYLPPGDRCGPARPPAESDRVEGDPVPIWRMLTHWTGLPERASGAEGIGTGPGPAARSAGTRLGPASRCSRSVA